MLEQHDAVEPDWSQPWSVSDGRAGNARQANALADALSPGAFREWSLAAHAPWRWLAPRWLPGARHAFGAPFAAALAAPPPLAIGCGRQAALATRLLRGQGTRVVQILDPRLDPRHWDLVVAPAHDGLSGDNVITTLGSLHPVDDGWLAQARLAHAGFADMPRPRTTLLLGGPSGHVPFDAAALEALATRLEVVLSRDGGSLLATTSRRTPAALRDALRARFCGTPGVIWCGGSPGDDAARSGDGNPYAGLLAWADRIVCSPDSVNMVSEACATPVPVFVFEPERVHGRPRRFLDALLASGRIRGMDADLAPFAVEPLRETARVAALVRARLA